jgi:HK97 family phage major capsid protein/HK97 family phage prohead protease
MPKPGKNETHQDFLDRCIPAVIHDGTAKDPAQGMAICSSIWEDSKKQMSGCSMGDCPMEDGMDPADCHMENCPMQQPQNMSSRSRRIKAGATVNGAGRSFANSAISSGSVNKHDSWSFSADDGNAMLGKGGNDWANYGKHFLGVDGSAPNDTKAHYKYPFAKEGTVYRSGLIAVRQRAGQQNETDIFDAAGALIDKIDGHPKSHKMYSLLEVKSLDEDLRILRGIASTPAPDRQGDIVEPLGVKFSNPIPLLWQHDSQQPIGQAKLGKPSEGGVSFEAKIPKMSEPGRLKDRLDEVWQSIKIGLVKGVSIGFRAVEMSFLKDGGIRFLQSEILELSLVTIPANAQATIEEIKAFDLGQRPVKADGGAKENGATKPNRLKGKTMPMTIAEQLSAFEAKRAASTGRMEALMQKAADDAQTLDDDESREYDDLSQSVSKIDSHIKRLKDLEVTNKSAAKPIIVSDVATGAEARSPTRVSVKPNVPPATAFTRYAMALAASKGNRWEALNIAKQWHDQTPEVELVLQHDMPMIMKAAVGVSTTTDATWASPLIAYQIMASEFIELLRPATIIGRIPGLRRVPFNIQMPRTTTGSSVGWVGENAPKPVSNMAFDTVQLRWAKAAGIIVLTEELVRFSNPAAEAVVRGDMIAAMAQFLDRQFVDPTVAAVTNVSPASITNGVTGVNRTGTNQAAFVTDVTTLLNTFITNNLSTAGGVWIMSQRQALSFSLMLNALGQPFYPNITAEGGTLLGYPVIASEGVPAVGNSPADGTPIIFALPREILLADDGQVTIDASNQASVQMDTAPDSPPTASTTLVSLWQMNFVGLRAERYINWLKRRSTAVGYITNAAYA